MIAMPHRSVTRFFIPLIDVLLLTFGVFLLMPISAETELEEQREQTAEKSEAAAGLQTALQDRLKELYKLEELRPDLERVAELKKEIELLRGLAQKSIQQSLLVKVIEFGDKGAILYNDPARAEQPVTPIPDAKTAHALIEEQRKEAQGRNVYYQFLRRYGQYPTVGQVRMYREWFKGVPNSLEVQP